LILLSEKDAAIASFAAAAAKLESAGHRDCTSQHVLGRSTRSALLYSSIHLVVQFSSTSRFSHCSVGCHIRFSTHSFRAAFLDLLLRFDAFPIIVKQKTGIN
jgi:hypothetical protein